MNKKTSILVHTSYWFYTFIFMETALQISYGKSWKTAFDFFNPVSLSDYIIFPFIFYVNYFWALPRYLKKQKYWNTFFAWFLLISLYILLRYSIQEVFLLKYFNICNYCKFTLRRYIIVQFFQAITWILLPSTVIWLFHSIIAEQKRNLSLQEEKLKNERAYLQAQLNPHFIFNSLHTIYSMVFHKADQSLHAIKTFSDILRHTLNPAKLEYVELSSELEHLKKYIELQEYRNNMSVVQFKVEGLDQKVMIPPLLLITLVENAFKHGIYTDPQQSIEIHLSITEELFYFSVKNKINPNRQPNSTSIGLPSLKRILELTYGNKHNLTIVEKDGDYKVVLKISYKK